MHHDKEFKVENLQSNEYAALHESEQHNEQFFHADEFNRDVEIEGNQLLEDLNGPHKKVEIIADVYDEDYSIHLNKTLNVPANWEVVPACFDLHELYTDLSCTTHYTYPGDGIDYHVYLSNVRG